MALPPGGVMLGCWVVNPSLQLLNRQQLLRVPAGLLSATLFAWSSTFSLIPGPGASWTGAAMATRASSRAGSSRARARQQAWCSCRWSPSRGGRARP